MPDLVEELNDYIQHKDFGLYRRRLLDAAYETQDNSCVDQAILWSKEMNVQQPSDNAYWLENGNKLQLKITNLLQAKPILIPIQLVDSINVSKSYGDGAFCLKPFCLQIYSGDIIGIVGENGQGKTTLLRCLAGQLKITSGDIRYFGIPSNDYYKIKHKVAFIPQRIPKWYGMLKDNLHFSAGISGLKGKDNERMVEFMLARLNLSQYANMTWDQISSGFRTRFEIARVLLQRPHLLILDEPLANLDIHAQQTLLNDLKFLVKSPNLNLGVILSSQQLHEVEKVADKVLLIKNGQSYWNQELIDTSKHDELVIELETAADRNTLTAILPNNINISYNGNFFTLSGNISTKALLDILFTNNIEVYYFRNITHSTKRFI